MECIVELNLYANETGTDRSSWAVEASSDLDAGDHLPSETNLEEKEQQPRSTSLLSATSELSSESAREAAKELLVATQEAEQRSEMRIQAQARHTSQHRESDASRSSDL